MLALGRRSSGPPGRPLAAALCGVLIVALAGCGSSSHKKSSATATAAQAATTASTRKTAPRKKPASHAAAKKQATKTSNHGSGPPAAPSPPPGGLRASGGYGMYELCSGHCSGSVPAALERPLHLPPAPGGGCPTSAPRGPVRPQGSPNIKITSFIGSSWEGAEVTWVASPSYRGPVLIRGRQLGGAGPVGFGEGHVPYDQLQLLDAAQGMPRGPSRKWPTFTRVHSPGCYAYQVDGTSFSDVIVFRAS